MIQIIAGTFGYYNGRKVVPLTEADGPQKFDPELEARLVKKGIAKYVEAPAVDEEPAGTDQTDAPAQQEPAGTDQTDAPAQQEPAGTDTAIELPEYSEDMKLDELKKIAAAYGVDASAMRKKADVIAAIGAAGQELDTVDEEPPQPGAAYAV